MAEHDGLEGAPREELLRQLRDLRDSHMRLAHSFRELRGENARLREAGDEMRDALDEEACPECTRHDLVGAWDAAKRGTHG